MSSDLTEAVSQVAATVVGLTERVRLGLLNSASLEPENEADEPLEAKPNLVGNVDKGVDGVAVLKGCFGEPNNSSRRALGCNN